MFNIQGHGPTIRSCHNQMTNLMFHNLFFKKKNHVDTVEISLGYVQYTQVDFHGPNNNLYIPQPN